MPGHELWSDKVIGWVVSAIITLLIWLIQKRLEPGAKLRYWIAHNFIFTVPLDNQPQPLRVQTSTLTVQNLGRKAAEDVEIIHAAKPDHFQLHPRRKYDEPTSKDGTHTLAVDSLGPKEVLQVQLLSHTNAPVLVGVRSREGFAKVLPIQINRVFPRYVLGILMACMFIGAFSILCWIVRAVLFISRANGML